MNFPFWIYILAQVFSLLTGALSYYRKSISLSGLISLVIISSLFIWLDKIPFLIIVFLMFASSSLLTTFKKNQKEEFKKVVAKTGSRDYIQALCNLGTATGIMLLYHFTQEGYLIAAFIGSVAAANADSWASEIGGLSKKQPVMITNFKPVAKGISGGVTALGTTGGIWGSLFIASIGTLTLLLEDFTPGNLYPILFAALLAGILGFILDSYLGAWFQALYLDQENYATENPTSGNLTKGLKWIDNDMVNLITTVAGGAIAAVMYSLFKNFLTGLK